jgi:DNA-binding cell septation regulator SpoVG
MKITNVEIIPIRPKNGLIAFANITIDDCLLLNSIGVHTKLNGTGYRLTYPIKQSGKTQFYMFQPLNKYLSKQIEKKVINQVEQIFEVTKTYQCVRHSNLKNS